MWEDSTRRCGADSDTLSQLGPEQSRNPCRQGRRATHTESSHWTTTQRISFNHRHPLPTDRQRTKGTHPLQTEIDMGKSESDAHRGGAKTRQCTTQTVGLAHERSSTKQTTSTAGQLCTVAPHLVAIHTHAHTNTARDSPWSVNPLTHCHQARPSLVGGGSALAGLARCPVHVPNAHVCLVK